MSKKQYGVGIVGFGFMGKTHTYGYCTIPFYYDELPIRYVLKGICRRHQETLDEALHIGGFEFGTTEYSELLNRDDIHMIHVCTPNHLHREQVVAALKAGKHVYCDKPLGASYADCEAILEAQKEYGRDSVAQVAHQYRYYPSTMRARHLVGEGFLGRVLSFRACYLHASSINPDKPLTWKLDKGQGGGGVLYDLGSHVLDLLGSLVGQFEEVCASTKIAYPRRKLPGSNKTQEVEADDQAVMLLRTTEGALGTLEASKIATGTNDELRIEIHGEKGAIRLNLMDPNWLEIYDVREPSEPMGGIRGFKRIETVNRYPPPGGKFLPGSLNVGWVRAHVACLFNFLAAIGGGTEASPTLSDAAQIQKVMDTAYRSTETRTWESVA